jgi:hypothetical protein
VDGREAGGVQAAEADDRERSVRATAALADVLHQMLVAWDVLRVRDLLFWHRDMAQIMLMAMIGMCGVMLLTRLLVPRPVGRGRVALPAILRSTPGRATALVRHAPLVLALAGVASFTAALADPYTRFRQQAVSFSGRRIALLIDASSSMMAGFTAGRLNAGMPKEAAFFTSVAAAESFVRQRIRGKYRDLIGLIEFGNEAYVVTPFTHDYDNILLSCSLIADYDEFVKFPDQGTTIALAIEQSVDLFKAFDFLNAAGNLMVIFSDGLDTQVIVHGRHVDDILAGALQTKIPVYFVRTAYHQALGDLVPDEIWRRAVELTGGRFYAASSETDILRAIDEIDRLSAGRIDVTQYSTEEPAYAFFTVVAVGLWALAGVLRLTVPWCRTFP